MSFTPYSLLTLLALSVSTSTLVAEPIVYRLTNDSVQDGFVVMAGGSAYWPRATNNIARWSGGDSFEIIFEGQSHIQTLTGAGNLVVWKLFSSGRNITIHGFDGNRVFTIAEDMAGIGFVVTDGTNVAWTTYTSNPTNVDVFFWDGNSTREISTTSASKSDLGISNGRVCWRENFNAYLWDGTQQRALPSPGGTGVDHGPSISGDYVAWVGRGEPSTDRKIWLHRISSGQTQTLDNGDIYQGIRVSEAAIAFKENRGGIKLWRHGTPAPVRLATSQRLPHLDSTHAIYADFVNDDFGVTRYEISSGRVQHFSTPGVIAHVPTSANGEIGWQGRPPRNNFDDIYIVAEASRFEPVVLPELFRRGDSNSDGKLDVSDAVGILNTLFLGDDAIRCLDAADANDDSKVDLSDAVLLLTFQFLGGDPPEDPGPGTCGVDPTDDENDCADSQSC